MNTALGRRLTPEQYNRLIEAACARLKLVRGEQECQDWWARRERYEKIAAGNLEFRRSPTGQAQTIFDRINESLGIVPSVRRFLLARLCKDLFGSVPFFYAKPEGPADKDLALKLQKHADWKLRMADYRNKIKEALGIALDLGECPIKTTWDKKIDLSERLAILLTDKRTGEPVLTADGDTIEDTDEVTGGDAAVVQPSWLPSDPAVAQPSWLPSADPAVVRPSWLPGGDSVLENQGIPSPDEDRPPQLNPLSFAKAPEIALDPALHEWREHFVEEQTVIYQGLHISACHWKDVCWPINAPSLADADFVAHTFDCRWSKLREKYAPSSFESAHSVASPCPRVPASPCPSDGTGSADAEIMAILEEIRGASRAPKSHESQPRDGEAEVMGGEDQDPIVKVCEASYDFDCFGDGIPRRLWLVLLPDYEKCLYADFRANISPRAAKPIHLLAVNQVKHRAYGRGLHEVYERVANAADQLLCSILYRNKINSDPVKIWNPDRTKEGKANPTLIIEPGRTYSVDGSQWGPKDILETLQIPDLDQRTWQLMELFMQLIQVDSGVTNVNQGDMSDLPANATATGVNSMLESSSVLHQYVLDEVRDSLTPHLGYAIELIYKMQDRAETFDYPEGNARQVMELSDARRLQDLPMNVEFLLTRTKRQEQREAAMAAIPMGVEYGQLPAPDQARLNDAFVQLFRSLGFDEPERFFPKPEAGAQITQTGNPEQSAQRPLVPFQNPEAGQTGKPMGQLAASGT